jgi:hypothetical protein
LLGNVAGTDSLARLLATSQGEMCEWNEPFRQDSEGLAAWMADSTADPDPLMSFIIRLPEPPAMADDRSVMAERTQPRHQAERNHPGSGLSCVSGSAIKRITAGVKARRDSPGNDSICCWAFTLPANQIQTKKEYCFRPSAANPYSPTLAGKLAQTGN